MSFKKVFAFCLVLALLALVYMPTTLANTANGVIYNAETIDGIDFHNGLGQSGGLVYSRPSPRQGNSSFMAYTPTEEHIMCFQYNGEPASTHVEGHLDLRGFSWIELDLYYQTDEDAAITMDFQFAVIGANHPEVDGAPDDHASQNGHDFDFAGVYMPANQWIHVKFPMSNAYIHSPSDKDTLCQELNMGNDALHYNANLADVVRSKYQFAFLEDENGDYPIDGVAFLIDNVHASKTSSIYNNQLVEIGDPIPPLFEGSKTVSSVSINTYPTNTTYDVGSEVFLDQGLSLNVNYSDGTSEIISTGFSLSGFDTSTTGTKVITATFVDKSVNFTIEVVDVMYGDVDGNGKIESTDALKTLQASIQTLLLSPEQWKRANVDGDEKVTASDALYILKKSINAIDLFPIQKES